MPLSQDITLAWQSENASGGALASALHVLRDSAVETPDELRRPSSPRTGKDDMSEVLGLLDEAKRANLRAAGQIQLAIERAAEQLAIR